MKFDLELIKPKVKGKSDKYSWNLYCFIRDYPHIAKNVFATKWNPYSGYSNVPANDLFNQEIAIGFIDSTGIFSGSNVKSICLDQKNANNVLYSKYYPDVIEDITDYFWENYIKYGVCFLEMNYEHKYNELKICEYCLKSDQEIDSIRTNNWNKIFSFTPLKFS